LILRWILGFGHWDFIGIWDLDIGHSTTLAFRPVRRTFSTMSTALSQSTLPFPVRRGKVRDVYEVGDIVGQPALLIVATDRISAFDVILPTPIPDKGKILTKLSLFWFHKFASGFENHLIETDVRRYPAKLQVFAEQLRRRSMLVKKAEVVPIECVARGYLAGSAWKEYRQNHTVAGHKLPPGMKHCDKLPFPIFTPATKEESGHDINITFEEAVAITDAQTAKEMHDRTLSLYQQAADYARAQGIIIADTKLEFGKLPDGRLILVDEVLTPDSSRFWPAGDYETGHDQSSYDKQFIRNWLEAQPWDKTPPAPPLPIEIIEGTRRRYIEAYEKLTGRVYSVE
jgi:phosphoribosylaminoimidazole-succinocarboxamide synthase